MTKQTEIPINFIKIYNLGMGRAEELLQIQQFDDWNGTWPNTSELAQSFAAELPHIRASAKASPKENPRHVVPR